MESEPRPAPDFKEAERLHRSSLLFLLLAHARQLIVPGLAVVVLASAADWEVWLMLFFVPVAAWEVVRYITTRYRFARDELIVSSGLIFRNERHVPFARIQSVDLVQGPFHRLFGVAEVRLETASGAKPEAILRVLSLPAVDVMRERVFAHRALDSAAGAGRARGAASVSTATAPARSVLITVPPWELAKLGVITNRGAVVVAAAVGFAWQFDLFDRIDYSELYQTVGGGTSVARAIGLGALLLLGAFVALSLFSIGWTLLRLFGFTLDRLHDDLRISCGLLTRRAATVPRTRIQFLSQVESPLHRLFRRVSVRVETAGGRGESEHDSSVSQRWFVPLATRAEAARIVRAIDLGIDLENAPWQPLAPGAARRMRKRNILVALAIALGLTLILQPFGSLTAWGAWGALTALPLVAFAWWAAGAEARYAAWARTAAGVYFRSGIFTRRRSATLLEKVQVVAVTRSPFDRRWGMATLAVDTAGAGPAGHRIEIPYLAEGTARELHQALVERSAESAFSW